MKIVETSMMQESFLLSFQQMVGRRLSHFCFENGYVTHLGNSKINIFCQELILDLGSSQAMLINDHFETQFLSQLHVIRAFIREDPIKNYKSIFSIDHMEGKINEIEIWGIKDESQDWDAQRIKAYKKKGLIHENCTEVEHLVSTQHIVHIKLENGYAVTIRSDSRNEMEVQVCSENEIPKVFTNNQYHLWETFN